MINEKYPLTCPAYATTRKASTRTAADPNSQVRPYGLRTFAAYDKAGELLAVTVYRKGARAVVDRITDLENEIADLRTQLAERS